MRTFSAIGKGSTVMRAHVVIGGILGATSGFVAGVLIAKVVGPQNADLPNLLGWAGAYLGSRIGRRLAGRNAKPLQRPLNL